MRLLIINGPNLNLLGSREPEIYGTETLSDLEAMWQSRAGILGISIDTLQTNHEGAIIDAVQDAREKYDGLVINAGAYSHYSYAIADAITASDVQTVEVHISNINEREEWRHHSVLTPVAVCSISGRGSSGYIDAIDHLHALLTHPPDTHKYGPEVDNVLDLRKPTSGGPHPVVVVVHGGFWRDIYTREIMDTASIDLTGRGWATVNIEYRRGAGSFPASSTDLNTAIDWVIANAALHDLDPQRIVALGHSAGGYLVTRAAHERDDLLGSVALGAVFDLPSVTRSLPDDDPAWAFLDATEAERPDLWASAAHQGLAKSPVHVVHGSEDETVDASQAKAYVQSQEGAAALTMLEGIGHGELVDPLHEAWGAVVDAVEGLSPQQ
jgi:3-dehydroquinate dehydratase-2